MRRMPFGASCRLPICRLGRQRHPPQSGYRTRPYSVRLTSVAEYFIALGTSFTLANVLKLTLPNND
jgi:hypothetical protein